MIDLLYRRYANPQFIFDMPADDGLSFILFAFKQEEDSLIYQRWIVGGQFSMSFDDFKAQLIPHTPKTDKAIMQDVEKILKSVTPNKKGGEAK